MKREYTQNGVTFLQSSLLSECHNIRHGFSTRIGGVSVGEFASLNLGRAEKDSRVNIIENFRRFGGVVGFELESLVFARQVHSDTVAEVTEKDCGSGLFRPASRDCDALVTASPNVALTVFSADCTPILLCDPVKHAVGAVHSGWRGTAAGIVKKTVMVMKERFGSDPADIIAAIGPCIGRCCFETMEDVPEAMFAALGGKAGRYITERPNGRYSVDLAGMNTLWLKSVCVNKIDTLNVCTACDPVRFWSHRKMGESRGSLASVIQISA